MRRHLNYANVVATFALVFAMTGGALAAHHYLINSTKQINPKVLKKLKGNAGATGPTGAQGKEGPPGKEATNAANALALGGIPASGYTRNDCGSTTGQIKGFAEVPASASFPSTFTKVSLSYNCSGQEVQAKRTGTGEYEVKFIGNPAAIAMGTSNAGTGFPDVNSVSVLGSGGDWKVAVYNGVAGLIDDQFELLVP